MGPRPTRAARFILLCLFLGLTTTVVIAWAAAAGPGLDSTIDTLWGRGLSRFEFWIGDRQRRFGVERYTSTVMIRAMQYEEKESGQVLPGWATLPQPATLNTTTNDHYELIEGDGWPFAALSYRFSGKGVGAATTGSVTGGIELPPRSAGAWYNPRALPLTPIPQGLAIDSVLFAAAWAAGLALAGSARSAWRRRHHRCPACGYEVRGLSTCPECGTNIASP